MKQPNKHLFYSLVYFIAALACGISSYVNENAFRIFFTVLCGVLLILSILSLIKYRMNRPRQI